MLPTQITKIQHTRGKAKKNKTDGRQTDAKKQRKKQKTRASDD
jgi:hypothetical protein